MNDRYLEIGRHIVDTREEHKVDDDNLYYQKNKFGNWQLIGEKPRWNKLRESDNIFDLLNDNDYIGNPKDANVVNIEDCITVRDARLNINRHIFFNRATAIYRADIWGRYSLIAVRKDYSSDWLCIPWNYEVK